MRYTTVDVFTIVTWPVVYNVINVVDFIVIIVTITIGIVQLSVMTQRGWLGRRHRLWLVIIIFVAALNHSLRSLNGSPVKETSQPDGGGISLRTLL